MTENQKKEEIYIAKYIETTNKNVDGKWIVCAIGADSISNAKQATIDNFDKAMNYLDKYNTNRKTKGLQPLSKELEVVFISNLINHYHYNVEKIIDSKIIKGELNNLFANSNSINGYVEAIKRKLDAPATAKKAEEIIQKKEEVKETETAVSTTSAIEKKEEAQQNKNEEEWF